MSDLQTRKDKIKEKRRQTPRRDYLREIVSRMPLGFSKNQGMISRYPKSDRSPKLLSVKEFNAMRDSLTEYGIDYDSNKSFFENFKILRKKVPLGQVIDQGGNENCEFADSCLQSKNAYLSSVIIETCENILYSFCVVTNSADVISSNLVIQNSNNIFQSNCVTNSMNIFYSKYIINSSDLRFCSNCVGCHHCITSSNLENASYYIKNKQYEKEEYFKIKAKKYGDPMKFEEYYTKVDHQGNNMGSVNCEGNYIAFSENVSSGAFVDRLKNGHNVMYTSGTGDTHDFYDCFDTGVNSNNFYGVEGGGTNGDNYYCVSQVEKSSHVFYCYYLVSCSFCLGCIGLKNQSYCIFNKQYDKEERYTKVDEIFTQMEKDGTLGKFFPGTMNPFYFNDTAAYLIDDSFDREEVTKDGYLRRNDVIKIDIPEGADVIETKDLSSLQGFENGKRTINPEILKKVIKDEKGNYYRVVQMEYNFLTKHGLPLPALHWMDRFKLGFRFK